MSFFARADPAVNAARKNAINKIGAFSQANYEAIVAEGLLANNRNAKRQAANAKANAAKIAAVNYANAIARQKAYAAVNATKAPQARQNAAKAAAAAAAANVMSRLKLGNTNASRIANIQAISKIIKQFNSSRFPTFVGTTRISKNIRNALVGERNKRMTANIRAQPRSEAQPAGNQRLNKYNKTNRKTNNGKNIYTKMTRNSSSQPFAPAGNGNWILANNGVTYIPFQ